MVVKWRPILRCSLDPKAPKLSIRFWLPVLRHKRLNNRPNKGVLGQRLGYRLRLLASSKAFIYLTRSDAFPLVVLESLSCGTPVVAYDTPAIRFNYAGTRAVIRVRPLDVKGLVNETYGLLRGGDWDRLDREGFEFSKRFTWDNVARAEWRALEMITNEG